MTAVAPRADALLLAEAEIAAEQAKVRDACGAVGALLRAIRDERLFPSSYPSFEAYCLHRFGMTHDGIRRVLNSAAEVQGNGGHTAALRIAAALAPVAVTTCAGCGAEFTPTRSDARYCRGSCRQRD